MSSELPARPGESLLIVGAGAVGCAAALTFARNGFRVTVVDPNEPGSGASFGNAGGIVPSAAPLAQPGLPYSVPGMLLDREGPLSIRPAQMVRALPWFLRFLAECGPERTEANSIALYALSRQAPDAWQELVLGTPAQDLVRETGWLKVYSTERSFHENSFERDMLVRRDGPIEILNADELRQLEPNLAPIFWGAIRQPDALTIVNPGRMIRAVAEEATAQGAVFRQEFAQDVDVAEDGRIALSTDQTVHHPDRLMICQGAYSGPLASKLGANAFLEAERGYHAMFETPERNLGRTVFWVDQSMVLCPMEDGVRMTTQSEFAGLNAPPDYRRLERQKKRAGEMLPGLNLNAKSRWMGRRPSTPDSLPYLGRAPATPRAYLNFGHNHLGLTLSAISAKVALADWMCDGLSAGLDMHAYRAQR